jgi:hypothetical protein
LAGRVFHSWNPGIRSYLAVGSRARQGKGVNSMAITSFTRFKGDKAEEMVKAVKQAKKIVEKHGAEFFRMSRFHTGAWIGEWLVVTRYADWEAYGKAQQGLANNPAWAKLLADTAKIANVMGRSLTVSVDP